MAFRSPFSVRFSIIVMMAWQTSLAIAQDIPATSTVMVMAAPSTTAPSAQYTNAADLQSAILNSTNTYRYQHNASDLVWNSTLASYAQSHVSSCKFAHTHGPYGENLAEGFDNITAAVDGWGNERASYNFLSGAFGESTGHFTQLVWKATTSTGCGAADCGDSGWLLFCEYYPQGNVIGQFTQEVQKQIRSALGDGNGAGGSSTASSLPSAGGPPGASRTGESFGGVRGYVLYLHSKTGHGARILVSTSQSLFVIAVMVCLMR